MKEVFMPKTSTQILTKQQKELLGRLLELAENKDEALTLTELEGFLFGLAITPDVIMTSEWCLIINILTCYN